MGVCVKSWWGGCQVAQASAPDTQARSCVCCVSHLCVAGTYEELNMLH
nr:MAG TPA: hypothetical protein [Caudoviricetes sp.]